MLQFFKLKSDILIDETVRKLMVHAKDICSVRKRKSISSYCIAEAVIATEYKDSWPIEMEWMFFHLERIGANPKIGQYHNEKSKILSCAQKLAAEDQRNTICIYDIMIALLSQDSMFLFMVLSDPKSKEEFAKLSSRVYWQESLLKKIPVEATVYQQKRNELQKSFPYGKKEAFIHEEKEISVSVADTEEVPVDTIIFPRKPPTESIMIKVLDSLGDSNAATDKTDRYNSLLNRLPVKTSFNPDDLYMHLSQSFPWMEELNVIIAQSSEACRQGKKKAFPHILIVGPPGVGKTAWASMVADKCGMISKIMSVGSGASGAFISGFERSWQSSQPSLPARVMCDMKVANPMIVLDEIDKSTSGSSGGEVPEAMLPLLDSILSAKYYDIFLQGSLNTQYISWMFTANNVSSLPQAFLDRVMIFNIPRIKREQVEIAAKIMVSNCKDLQESEQFEVYDMMIKSYQEGGSLRALEGAMEKYIRNKLWTPPVHSIQSLLKIEPQIPDQAPKDNVVVLNNRS